MVSLVCWCNWSWLKAVCSVVLVRTRGGVLQWSFGWERETERQSGCAASSNLNLNWPSYGDQTWSHVFCSRTLEKKQCSNSTKGTSCAIWSGFEVCKRWVICEGSVGDHHKAKKHHNCKQCINITVQVLIHLDLDEFRRSLLHDRSDRFMMWFELAA